MKIGEKISELRKKNNLTQEELAEKLNVTRQTISKWELGETSPSLDDAATLASIFQVSLDTLVGKDNVLEEKMSNLNNKQKIILGCIIFIMILVIIIKTLIFGDPVSGWPSLVCIIFFVSGVQLFCLGIIGQYLSKTYLEVKNRPVYIIKETEKDVK